MTCRCRCSTATQRLHAWLPGRSQPRQWAGRECPAKRDVVVASNGGPDLVYLPQGDTALAANVVAALAKQDYVNRLFADDSLGRIPGMLPLSAIALQGSAVTPMPAIAVNFRSFTLGCADPTTCGVEVADTGGPAASTVGDVVNTTYRRGTRGSAIVMVDDFDPEANGPFGANLHHNSRIWKVDPTMSLIC